MKVVQQLIAYFEARGRLPREQMEQFVSQGYFGQYNPEDLRSLERQIGQSFFFRATGNVHGPLWGTDVYTSDSDLGTACVHAGVLRPGETGAVKVTLLQPPPTFKGSRRNGVASADWNTGWNGAYRVEPIQ